MTKVINKATGQVLGAVLRNHRMTKDELIEFAGLERNPRLQEDFAAGEYIDANGNEVWYDDVECIDEAADAAGA